MKSETRIRRSAVLVVWLAVAAIRRGLSRTGWALVAILAVQILVGALNVWLEEYEALIVLHLGLGTLLWVASTWTTLQLYRVPVATSSEPAVDRRELVTA